MDPWVKNNLEYSFILWIRKRSKEINWVAQMEVVFQFLFSKDIVLIPILQSCELKIR